MTAPPTVRTLETTCTGPAGCQPLSDAQSPDPLFYSWPPPRVPSGIAERSRPLQSPTHHFGPFPISDWLPLALRPAASAAGGYNPAAALPARLRPLSGHVPVPSSSIASAHYATDCAVYRVSPSLGLSSIAYALLQMYVCIY